MRRFAYRPMEVAGLKGVNIVVLVRHQIHRRLES
jgi:hypothetical protein